MYKLVLRVFILQERRFFGKIQVKKKSPHDKLGSNFR